MTDVQIKDPRNRSHTDWFARVTADACRAAEIVAEEAYDALAKEAHLRSGAKRQDGIVEWTKATDKQMARLTRALVTFAEQSDVPVGLLSVLHAHMAAAYAARMGKLASAPYTTSTAA